MAIDRAQQNWPEEMTQYTDADNQLWEILDCGDVDGNRYHVLFEGTFVIAMPTLAAAQARIMRMVRLDAQGEDEFEYLRRTR